MHTISNDGKKEGIWTSYFTDGTLQSQGAYKNNKKHGKWMIYFSDGRLKETIDYVNNEISGEWNTYHNDSTIAATNYFKDGTGLGIRKEFYSNGLLKVHIQPDPKNKDFQTYNSYYKSGKKETSGRATRGKILSPGKRIGVWETYFENGNLKESKNHIADTDKIEAKYYYENGNLKECGTTKQKYYPIGEWKSYYKSGELKSIILYPSEINFKAKSSTNTYFSKDGSIKLKRIFSSSGKLYQETKYENGIPKN